MDVIKGYNSLIISAFGNPLLDMHIRIDSTDILNQYGLDLDCEKEVTKEVLAELQELRSRYNSITNAGGSAQNTLRMFQWLLGLSNGSVIFGAVGQDDEGRTLEALMKNAGVCTKYTYHKELPTGRCVALVNGEHRALVAHIGAAAVYEPHHLDQKDHLETLAQSKVVYIEGFFLSHSFPVAEEVITFCKSRGILIAFNLSSVYICKNHAQEVVQLIKYADIVFGNEAAYTALTMSSGQLPEVLILQGSKMPEQNEANEVNNYETHVSTRSTVVLEQEKTHALPFGNLKLHGKICISTNGPHPVACTTSRGSQIEVQVPALDRAVVKDTTGAGDAFVAGFLAGAVEQRHLEACIELGCRMAARVIQHVGCQVPACSPSEVMSVA